jgi:hypothetical protein
MNITLIGASTANLYAAKKLTKLGHTCTIYDSKTNLNNPQTRQLPSKFLKKLGFIKEDDNKDHYIKLTDLKLHLAKDLNIIFNTKVDINDMSINKTSLDFDYAIIITGHKDIKSKLKNVFTYNYQIEPSDNHYAGRSLITAVNKVDKIIKNIIHLSPP